MFSFQIRSLSDRGEEVVVDVETESEGDLEKLGAYAYSVHPSTDVACVSWRRLSDPAGSERIWRPALSIFGFEDMPYELKLLAHPNGARARLLAFNAFFEQCIWNNILVPRYGWCRVDPRQWECLAVRAAYYGFSQNLERCAIGMGLPEGKDTEGHNLMMAMTRPSRRSKKTLAAWDENVSRQELYCQRDVKVEADIAQRLPPIPDVEQQNWRLDQQINFVGIPFDVQLVDAAVALRSSIIRDASRQLSDLTNKAITSPGQTKRMQAYVSFYLPEPLENFNANTVKDLLKDPSLPDDARQICELRQQAGSSAIAKFERAKQQIVNGRARGLFRHYGAHTGRPTGQGTQPSNMPRLKFKTNEERDAGLAAIMTGDYERLRALDGKNPTNVLTKSVRPSICAEPGNVFVASDYSGIELRVATWLVGDTVKMETIRQRGSSFLYLEMAQAIYNRDIDKEKDWLEYTTGKAAVLGCGYQMWVDRFITMTFDNYGAVVDHPTATRAVNVYRASNPLVVNAWADLKRMVIDTVSTGFPNWYRDKLHFRLENGALVMTLPSGRELWYQQARVETDSKGREGVTYLAEKNKKLIRGRLYGGLILENAVQAISRDLLYDAMPRLAALGWQTISHCYDEIVSEVPSPLSGRCLTDHKAIMLNPPAWAAGLFLEIESWIGRRYRK